MEMCQKASALGFMCQKAISNNLSFYHRLFSLNWQFHRRGFKVPFTCYTQVLKRQCYSKLSPSEQLWKSKFDLSRKSCYSGRAVCNHWGNPSSKLKSQSLISPALSSSSCIGVLVPHINMSSTSSHFTGNPDKGKTSTSTYNKTPSRSVDCKEDEVMMREAKEIFIHAVNAVLPNQMIRSRLEFNPTSSQLVIDGTEYKLHKNVHVVGFGKAVLGMARALEDSIGDHIARGVISVPFGAQAALRKEGKESMLLQPSTKIQVMEGAANNLPDEHAHLAATKIKDIVKDIGREDILVVLISGGGSALLPAPEPPVTLNDMLAITKLMSRAGASIMHLNTVRKQIDSLKGGGLAILARPAKVISLILSDVIGDPLDFIASGPTVPDLTRAQESLKLFSELGITLSVPTSVIQLLEDNNKKELIQDKSDPTQGSGHSSNMKSVEAKQDESVKYYQQDWSHVQNVLVGTNVFACQAACEKSMDLGLNPLILTTELEGEARKVGIAFARLAYYVSCQLTAENVDKTGGRMKDIVENLILEFGMSGDKLNEIDSLVQKSKSEGKGVCIIAGGETTVSVTGDGKGGRNQEMAVATALELQTQFAISSSSPLPVKVVFLSAGTDGQDGPTLAAGGVVGIDFASLVEESGLNASEYLKRNDTFNLLSNFKNGSNLVVTGLTGTNVMDIHVLLVERKDF